MKTRILRMTLLEKYIDESGEEGLRSAGHSMTSQQLISCYNTGELLAETLERLGEHLEEAERGIDSV